MKAEWIRYLESIGIGTEMPFFVRVKEVVDFYSQVYPEQIDDIFVTEYFDADGNRQYVNLWLFSDTSMMEAKNFLNEDDFDWAPLKQHIVYWSITKTDYDFQKATDKSRLALDYRLLSGIAGQLNASRGNCDNLKALFFKLILPNTNIMCSAAAQQMDAGDGQ